MPPLGELRCAIRRIVFTAGLAVFAPVLLPTPAFSQQKRVYIGPDDHTDYFWSADEAAYRQAFLDMLDYYLDLADSTAGNPPEYQSRWNCDGSFWMWTYEKNKPPADFLRLIERIRSGHISVPLNALAVNQGGVPAEAILRGMYYSGQIERAHDLRFRLAYNMENQTHPYGIWALWAGAGAKYSWKGVCGCDTITPDLYDRDHEIYWAVGPDGSRVLVKWNSLTTNSGIGGYAECRWPAATVDYVTVDAPFNGFLQRYPFEVVGAFGKGWDDIQTQTDEFVTVAQQATDATRQIIVSNEEDFFTEFEQRYGAQLATQSASFGNEWDLYCASLAEVSARIKRSLEKLRATEAMAAIVSLFDASFMDGRQAVRDQAWMDFGLFWEHDFGMVGPPTGSAGVTARIAWQRRLAGEIETYVDSLYSDAAEALADLIPANGPNQRFYVFNSLSWSRDDYADLPYIGPTPVHVLVAGSQVEVPSQILTVAGQTVLRILAEDVPAVGYKVYEIRPGAGTPFPDAATVSGGGPGGQTVVYAVASNDRDAMSVAVGQPAHEVRISGYNAASDPRDYAGADAEQETAAMEFAVDLPVGSTIQEAYVTVRAGPYANPSPTGGMRIHMYDVADAAPFANGFFGDLINHHPTHSTTVLWPVASWPNGSDQMTPDLASLVQTFVNRPDYAPGNHIGFVFTEGTIQAGSYYGWQEFAAGGSPPTLTVVYLPPGKRDADDLIVENDVLRVTVTPRGAITSLIDKTRGNREFAQFVGGRAINDLGPSSGTLTVESLGPVSVTVQAVATSPLQHTTRITLYRGGDRVDVHNEITQNFDATYTYGFGFNLASPEVRHEEVGAILRARLVSDDGHYAARNARYDWLTLNHFADVTGSEGVGVTLSNADCYFFRLGNSSSTFLDTVTPQISPLLGGRVANGDNGLPSQGGDSLFVQRFALRTHDAFDGPAAMRTALAHQNPLVSGLVSGAGPQLPGDEFSGVSISSANVLLWAIKPAEEGIGDGIIARLWNLAETPQTADVQLAPYPILQAMRTTHLETDDGGAEAVTPSGISPSFARQQIRTLRLHLARCGDFDGDGDTDASDQAVFVNVLLGVDPSVEHGISADLNRDGQADGKDIAPFVGCRLANG